MKINLLKRVTFLAVLSVLCAHSVWAQGDDYQKAYFTALKAQSSTAPEATGFGKVQLTLVDITGTQLDGLGENPNPSDMSKEENGNTVTMLGGTLFATDGLETPVHLNGQIYMTSYSYFKADAYAAAGSYFAGWTYTDKQITKQDTAMDKTAETSTYFKVLPDSSKYGGVKMGEQLQLNNQAQLSIQYVMQHPYNIYAVFKKYLLSNPAATAGQVVKEDNKANAVEIKVSFDVEGDIPALRNRNLSDIDFDNFSIKGSGEDGNEWNVGKRSSVDVENATSQKLTIILPIVFNVNQNTTLGIHKATLTIQTAGDNPSKLEIPIAVTVLDLNRPYAILFNGKVEQDNKKAEGSVTDLIGKISELELKEPIIQLQRNCENLTLGGQNFTLDLNGNETGDITIKGGNVTIAYSKFGGKAGAVTVTNGGKLILNGDTLTSLKIDEGAEVEQNGATIRGLVTNDGKLTTTEGKMLGGLTSSGDLTINGGSFAGDNAITITDGTAILKRGSIDGTTYGVLAKGGTTTIEKLAAITGGTNSVKAAQGTVIVKCGKFGAPLAVDINNFVSGYFVDKNYGFEKPADKMELQLTTGVEYNEGYRHFLGTQDAAKNNDVGVCRIGETSYATLEDALAYAKNIDSKEKDIDEDKKTRIVIFMTNDYTLSAGHYTIPANTTIVVPMSDSLSQEVNMTVPRVVSNDVDKSHPYKAPKEFRRLTLSEGVNIEVFGAIEMAGTQFSSNEPYTGQSYGAYGHIVMEKGSHMTLQANSEVRAWGYMTGEGEIDARRDSKVREFFQMGDWKGALTSASVAGIWGDPNSSLAKSKVFPITQYFIQNIEVPVKYHPGATLSTATAVSEGLFGTVSVAMAANDIVIVGVTQRDSAIFVMDNEADAENTWVRKWYDADNDIQTYEVNNSAHIGSMVLDMGELAIVNKHILLNSAKFDLPITSNMKIHLLSGNMDFMQNTSLLPGAEVEVDKKSTVTINIDPEDKEHTGALYVYDAQEWGRYVYREVGEGAFTKVVRYAPTWNGTPTRRNEDDSPVSAKINVHGTFKTGDGYVYTSESGANIFSSNEDAGTFIFNQSAATAGTREVYQIKGSNDLDRKTFSSAQLMNGNGKHEATASASVGDAYCYMDNYWTILKVDKDNDCFMLDNHGSFYAKPQEYVKIVATKDAVGNLVGNTDHTYSDAAGTGRLFILMKDDCQWWEVEKKDNLYHCIHPDNDTYYEWNDIDKKWQEKRCFITWKNWDGDTIKTKTMDEGGVDEVETKSYSVPYGTMAEFLGPNPTRPEDIDYTYDFTGWTPALGKVTSDVTYTATYERKPRKYTITFCNEGGSVIERQFLTHNEVPVCENVPTKIGHYLQWDPAIAAVTGDATYTATWLEEKPTAYEVRFVDYDGTELQKPMMVTAGEKPEYTGDTPTGKAEQAEKDGNKEFTYIFDHWSPKITPVDAAITYTAVYKEVAKTYTIEFRNDDEESSLIETNQYAYGAIPVCSKTPTEPNDADYAQYTYTFAWTPQIAAVREDRTGVDAYKATWSKTTNKYTITLTSNMPNAVILTGAGIYDYNTQVTLQAKAKEKEGFVFKGWKETNKTDDISLTVTADATYTAIVERTTTVENHTVAVGETWDAAGQTVKDLILCSNGTQSGQIENITNLTLDGNAYFDLTLNAAADHWYAIAVPWTVNVSDIRFDGSARTVNRDFFLLTYNGDVRAAQGTVDACWSFITDGALQPGKSYMLYLRSGAKTIRFPKKAGASLAGGSVGVYAYPSQTGNDIDAGWNGIANPVSYYAILKTGTTFGQRYKAADDSYDLISDLDNHTFVVGEPVFVQVKDKTIDRVPFSASTNNPSAAPRRLGATTAQPTTYEVRIAAQSGTFTDRLYIAAAEEKEDIYVIGQDLVKMGVSARVAQMWVDRYNARLCANVTELADSQAEFPLGIYAPKSGTYTIATPTALPDNEELYITVNGKPVWSLANGEYIATLNAGNTDNYGLLLVRKAPQITTGFEQTAQDNTFTRKVLINGQVYIIRDGNVYSIFGQQIQ